MSAGVAWRGMRDDSPTAAIDFLATAQPDVRVPHWHVALVRLQFQSLEIVGQSGRAGAAQQEHLVRIHTLHAIERLDGVPFFAAQQHFRPYSRCHFMAWV